MNIQDLIQKKLSTIEVAADPAPRPRGVSSYYVDVGGTKYRYLIFDLSVINDKYFMPVMTAIKDNIKSNRDVYATLYGNEVTFSQKGKVLTTTIGGPYSTPQQKKATDNILREWVSEFGYLYRTITDAIDAGKRPPSNFELFSERMSKLDKYDRMETKSTKADKKSATKTTKQPVSKTKVSKQPATKSTKSPAASTTKLTSAKIVSLVSDGAKVADLKKQGHDLDEVMKLLVKRIKALAPNKSRKPMTK